MEDVPDEIEGTQMTCLKDPEQPDPQVGRENCWESCEDRSDTVRHGRKMDW